jgi:hypothetical protein
LVLSVKDKDPGAAVLSVQLTDMAVSDCAASPGYKLIPDCGLKVSGAFTGRVGMHGSQRITKYVVLGTEPAARNFRDALGRAMQAVRK